MTTTGELQNYVRSTVDVTSADLPDAVLNVWLQDGYNRVLQMEARWPFFEVVDTLVAAVGQRSYDFSVATPQSMQTISAVIDNGTLGNGWPLTLVNYDQAAGKYVGVLDSPGQPLYYSKRGNQIHLWPKPNAAYVYTVIGYRNPANWILAGTGGSPDCDSRFHLPIADWALARYFRQQEDPQMAQVYEQSFKDGAQLAHEAVMRVDQDFPLILNRGFASPTTAWWLQSLGRNLGT